MTAPLLVLVHPGSACGSANMNLGRFDARAARESLIQELKDWRGGVLVIEGSLSDELADYPNFADAIAGALHRAHAAGAISLRVAGGDDEDLDQTKAAQAFLAEHALDPETTPVTLTGAWYADDGTDGCVNDVQRVFESRRFRCEVVMSALSLPEGFDEADDLGGARGISP